MIRMPSLSFRNRLFGPVVLLAGLALLVAVSPARAGFGDLVKKAKEKATKVVAPAEEAPGASDTKCQPEFDAVTVELTEARVAGIVATYKAAGEVGAGRPALVAKLNKVLEEKNAISEKHWEKIEAIRMKRSDIEGCYYNGYEQAAGRKTQEYMQRMMTDPVLKAKFAKVAAQINATPGLSDSAKLARVSQAGMEEMTPSKEDSAEVRKSCGPLPPKFAEEARFDALEKEERELNDQIARLDEKVSKTQIKTMKEQGGLDDQQWPTALERIRGFLGWARHDKGKRTQLCGFTKIEAEALEKHAEELRAVLG